MKSYAWIGINGWGELFKCIYPEDIGTISQNNPSRKIFQNSHIKYSQYNVFPTKKEDTVDKFVITKSVLEKMFDSKVIPKVAYELENTTVKKLNPEDYIKKKK